MVTSPSTVPSAVESGQMKKTKRAETAANKKLRKSVRLSEDPHYVAAMREANYGAYVDPYRGMLLSDVSMGVAAAAAAAAAAVTNTSGAGKEINRGGRNDNNDQNGREEEVLKEGEGSEKLASTESILRAAKREVLREEEDALRPSELSPLSTTITMGVINQPNRRQRQWQCTQCTLLNLNRFTKCEVCGLARRSGGGLMGTTNHCRDDEPIPSSLSSSVSTHVDGDDNVDVAPSPSPDQLPQFSSSASQGDWMNGMVNLTNPWVGCCNAINCSTWTFANASQWKKVRPNTIREIGNFKEDGGGNVIAINYEDDERRVGCGDGREEEAAILVKIGCPTVDGWADIELDAYNKKLNKDAKKKSNNKRMGSRGGKRVNAVGMKNENSIITELQDIENMRQETDISPSVRNTQFICGKRKHDAKEAQHPCDYNPFCLASLGGIMDQYRESAAKVWYANRDQALSVGDISRLIYEDLIASIQSSSLASSRDCGITDDDKFVMGDSQLRGSDLVDRDDVRAHMSRCCIRVGGGHVKDIHRDATVDECVGQIESYHRLLIFCPPSMAEEKEDMKNKVRLSTPAGLRNLGATCYLNSHLQCLSQNLGFLSGLFSWKKSRTGRALNAADKRMSTVLTNIQSILARMRYGPDKVICTNDFAVALGLENDEMQDPNEFARLLFDRMAESFRRSADIVVESDSDMLNSGGLGELLPSVFGGSVNYVTKCHECGLESKRSEDFMEISLPIVQCGTELDLPDRKPIKGNKKSKNVEKNASAAGEVDVQQCVNAYLHPESLDGDNQYDCSRCDRKCDATRSMIMARLPPVLNIQLARYVFDRNTCSKRKLMTKVLLPKTLKIAMVKYMLCAVQDHLGTSAHGGHFTADVMDWKTGKWYKFNDEEVTILESGPNSSFETEDGDDLIRSNGHGKVDGSQDAYNLLYVQEKYLSEQCDAEMRRFIEGGTSSEAGAELGIDVNVISSIEVQRRKRYEIELQLMTKKWLKDRRTFSRREKIVKDLLSPGSPLIGPTWPNSGYVWLPFTFLMQAVSIDDDFEEIFQAAPQTVFRRESFLCEHSRGLDTRMARKGKLISQCIYDKLEAIVQDEYSMFLRDQGLIPTTSLMLTLFDEKFIFGVNLTCQDCEDLYRNEIRQKIDILTTLVAIYDELLPGRNDFNQSSLLESSEIFAISRTWVTSFKAYVEKLVNSLNEQNKGSFNCGGIDILDLSAVMRNDEAGQDSSVVFSGDSIKTLDPFKGEDPTSKITCKHGCSHLMHNGRSVRLICGRVWWKINKLFSKALPHPFEYKTSNATGNCAQCHLDAEEERLLPEKLNEWTNTILQSALVELLRRGKQVFKLYPSEVDHLLQNHAEGPLSLRAVPQADVQLWRDCFRIVEKASKKNSDVIRKQVFDVIPSKSLSLICIKHQLTAGVPSLPERGDVTIWLEELNRLNVELLLDDEYEGLLHSLSVLESTLHIGNGSKPPSLNIQPPPSVSIRLQERRPIVAIHPQACIYGCSSCLSDFECINLGMLSHSSQSKRAKPAHEAEIVDEAPKGPLCKIFVHEVENGTSVDVAASSIMVNVFSNNSPSLTVTGRPRRSRKARGEEGCIYSTEDFEMALDGNLAHLRLLLHHYKGKKLLRQRLFLLHICSPEGKEKPSAKELTHEYNIKSMHEIAISFAHDSDSIVGSTDKLQDHTIHLILSYDDGVPNKPNNRTRSNQEEIDEEDSLALALFDVACGGWKSDVGSVSIGVKPIKRPRQERGFQGTFLQSTEFDARVNLPQQEDSPHILQQHLFGGIVSTGPEDSTDNVLAHDDIVHMTRNEGREMAKTVETIESNIHAEGILKPEAVDQVTRVNVGTISNSDDNRLDGYHLASLNELSCYWCARKLDTDFAFCKKSKVFFCCLCKNSTNTPKVRD